jgi:type IV secretion system protein VirB1
MTLFVDLAAHCAPGLAPDFLAAIASVESGMQPFSVYSEKTREILPSVGAGVAFVVGQLDQGNDVAIGLMGLDARSLSAEGLSYVEAFEPCANLAAAGRVLKAIWVAAEKMGMPPTRAERHVARVYYARSLARVGSSAEYEARVMAEKQRLQGNLPKLAVAGAESAAPKPPAAQKEASPAQPVAARTSGVESSTVEGRSVNDPSWDVYGGEKPSGMVVFSKK